METSLKKPKAYLFDVDGTLTDPEAKKVVRVELFEELVERLQENSFVGLNTGRSIDFVEKEIIQPLMGYLPKNDLLQHLCVIGEIGAVQVTFDSAGKATKMIDAEFTVPAVVNEKIKFLLAKPDFSELMFLDKTKEAMCSIELMPGKKVSEFREPQQKLISIIANLLVEMKLNDTYMVEGTRIAIDIYSKKLGKALGAQKFVDFIDSNNNHFKTIVCFGDSPLDYDMHEYFLRAGLQSQFVFVGEKELLKDKDQQNVVYGSQLFDAGVLAFLEAEN